MQNLAIPKKAELYFLVVFTPFSSKKFVSKHLNSRQEKYFLKAKHQVKRETYKLLFFNIATNNISLSLLGKEYSCKEFYGNSPSIFSHGLYIIL